MKSLTVKELQSLKAILESVRDELELKLSKEHNLVILEENDHKDSVDAANESVAVAYQNRMRNREFLYLKKIRGALHKIKDGTYGQCEDCDAPIGFARLMARPTADFCVVCKEEAEGVEHHSAREMKPKSMGQTLAVGNS